MTDKARNHMIERLGAQTLSWEIDGPPDTLVKTLQCWSVPAGQRTRLVIVEVYEDGGFDVFPQILTNRLDADHEVLTAMARVEAQIT